jgi:hypothetical protein
MWYWGFYMSEHWMRIIDFGVPWSWLGALFLVSYSGSLVISRKSCQTAILCLIGPILALTIFQIWVDLCAIKFDPFY